MTEGPASLWARILARVRESTWAVSANDGTIAVAGTLQGFAGAGAGDRLLLFAATAATIAGALSAGGAEWALVAAEREVELALAAEERHELATDPAGELDDLAAYWQGRGLAPDLARQVAEQLTAHDAVAAQLDADHGLEEITSPTAPWVSGAQTTLAFAIGAAVPLLITYFVPLAIEDTLIIVAVIISLCLTSLVAAGVGRLSGLRMLMRSLAVGLGTMGISYLAGSAFF
jgi:VIT1/CCC1 family predicted Fe2+/Mn2+ transporter